MPRTSKDIITKCPKCGSSSIDFTFCERIVPVTHDGARFVCDLVGGTIGFTVKTVPYVGKVSDYIGSGISSGLKYMFDIEEDKNRTAHILLYRCNACDNKWEEEWNGHD